MLNKLIDNVKNTFSGIYKYLKMVFNWFVIIIFYLFNKFIENMSKMQEYNDKKYNEKNGNYIKMAFFSFVFILIGTVVFDYTISGYPYFSSYPAIFGNVGVAFLILHIFDRFGLKEINIQHELKKNNVSVAIFVLAIAIIIAASILST